MIKNLTNCLDSQEWLLIPDFQPKCSFVQSRVYNCDVVLLCMYACSGASVSDSATAGIVACQASLSMGFFRQEYRSGLPCPTSGDLQDPGIKPMSPVSPALQADSLPRAT